MAQHAKHPSRLAWFEAFLAEFLVQQREHAILGPHITAAERPRIRIWDDAGWYVTLGKVQGGGGSVSAWFDRYLDRRGDHHLGAWYQATAARVQQVASVLEVDPADHYRKADRDAAGYLVRAAGSRALNRLKELLIDDWGRAESYVGAYVMASPHLQAPADAIGPVVKQLRSLAEAARSDGTATTSHNDDLERLIDEDAERHTELIKRLARPQQALFRAAVIRVHQGRCVITGCADLAALEAAHIVPVGGGGTDHPNNGLLLRADLHHLFDAGLLTISVGTDPRVLLDDSIATGHYGELHAKELVGSLSIGQRKRLEERTRQRSP